MSRRGGCASARTVLSAHMGPWFSSTAKGICSGNLAGWQCRGMKLWSCLMHVLMPWFSLPWALSWHVSLPPSGQLVQP